jgi:hypothetical protein
MPTNQEATYCVHKLLIYWIFQITARQAVFLHGPEPSLIGDLPMGAEVQLSCTGTAADHRFQVRLRIWIDTAAHSTWFPLPIMWSSFPYTLQVVSVTFPPWLSHHPEGRFLIVSQSGIVQDYEEAGEWRGQKSSCSEFLFMKLKPSQGNWSTMDYLASIHASTLLTSLLFCMGVWELRCLTIVRSFPFRYYAVAILSIQSLQDSHHVTYW